MLHLFGRKKTEKIELYKAPGDRLLAVADDRQGLVPRFEQAEAFTITVVRDGAKQQRQVLNLSDTPVEKLPDLLASLRIDAVIAKSFSPKTYAALRKMRIQMYTFDGGPNAAFKAYASGSLNGSRYH